jgi:hypothetical protein
MILGCDGAGRLADGTEVVLHPVIGGPGVVGDDRLDPKRTLLTEKAQGTFADTVVVPARNAVAKPARLSMAQAAAMGTAWLTAYRMLFVKSGAAPRADDAGAGRLRWRRDSADPTRSRGRHAGVGDRTARGPAGLRRQRRDHPRDRPGAAEPAVEVDVVPPEGHQLTAASAAGDGQPQEDRQLLVGPGRRVEQLSHLLGLRRQGPTLGQLRRVGVVGRVAVDPPQDTA